MHYIEILCRINLVLIIGIILLYSSHTPETIDKYYTETNNVEIEDDKNYLTFRSRDYGYLETLSPFLELVKEIPMTDDIISIQLIRIPNENWKNPNKEIVEYFPPRNRFGRVLIMKPYIEENIFGENHQLAFGLSISASIGFNIRDYGSIQVKEAIDNVGAVYVSGEINNEKVMFWSIYGEWELEHGGYDNPKNIVLLRQLFKKSEGYKTVALGSLNVTYKETKNLGNELGFNMEEGPLLTFHDDGYRSTDHVMVKNCKIVKQPTIMSVGKYHEWFTDIRVNIKKQRIINPNEKLAQELFCNKS